MEAQGVPILPDHRLFRPYQEGRRAFLQGSSCTQGVPQTLLNVLIIETYLNVGVFIVRDRRQLDQPFGAFSIFEKCTETKPWQLNDCRFCCWNKPWNNLLHHECTRLIECIWGNFPTIVIDGWQNRNDFAIFLILHRNKTTRVYLTVEKFVDLFSSPLFSDRNRKPFVEDYRHFFDRHVEAA